MRRLSIVLRCEVCLKFSKSRNIIAKNSVWRDHPQIFHEEGEGNGGNAGIVCVALGYYTVSEAFWRLVYHYYRLLQLALVIREETSTVSLSQMYASLLFVISHISFFSSQFYDKY